MTLRRNRARRAVIVADPAAYRPRVHSVPKARDRRHPRRPEFVVRERDLEGNGMVLPMWGQITVCEATAIAGDQVDLNLTTTSRLFRLLYFPRPSDR